MAPLADDPAGDANLENLAKRIEAYQKEYAGQLAGKIVLLSGAIEVTLPEEAVQTRLDDAALADIFSNETLDPVDPLSWPIWDYPAYTDNWRNWAEVPLNVNAGYYELYSAVWNRLSGFLATEGVVAILKSDSRGDGSVIHADDFGNWLPGAAPEPPTLALSADQYNRIVRLVERDIAVELEIDVDITTSDEAADLRNVVATIPGGRKRNEVVMLGGHLDSWHGAVGATDNAAGCAVAMEAMRILKALDLNMDRTVRMALWDGEEQNYYGSRAYVQENFADRVSMQTKPAHARLSAYYNVDNGAGKIRGVYLQSNDMARPIFESWFAPLADLDVDTVSIRATTETDHLAFDTVGLPGFQFIQDPLEYESRSHHTDEDSMDRIVPADLKQAAAVLAIVVYHTANRAELMPRKPLPKPLPEPVELPEILR
jgi:hypothetical protein